MKYLCSTLLSLLFIASCSHTTPLKRELASSKTDPEQKSSCGLTGTLEERIKDCGDSENKAYVLVARSADGLEMHKEIASGLLWSDRLPRYTDHFKAVKKCNGELKEVMGLKGHNWRLPTIEEYRDAEKNGIRQNLPNMGHWFWSSTSFRDYHPMAWLYYGGKLKHENNKRIDDVYRDYFGGSIRCVAEHN